jgi:hypothetical protein
MSDAMRIGDTERERALASLGEHYAVGRLTKEELDERSDAVWTARTRHDLAVLFADLPTPAPAARPPARRPVRRRFRMPPVPVLLLVLALVLLLKVPLLLLALGVWFLLSRRHWSGGCGHRAARGRTYSTSYDRAYSSGS